MTTRSCLHIGSGKVGMTSIQRFRSVSRAIFVLELLLLTPGVVFSQQPAPVNQPAATNTNKPDTSALEKATAQAPNPGTKGEVSNLEQGTTFRLNVNLVQVHVTVRDSNGKAVPNLRKEDFLLYDQGKPQPISTFSVETRETRREEAKAASKSEAGGETEAQTSSLPDRFVALTFDDTHMSLQDANYLRTQANKFLDGLAPTDRVAIFSSSGQMSHEFTNDKESLKRTLLGLIPRPRYQIDHNSCPDVNYYEADQIVNYENPNVLSTMIQVVQDLCPPPFTGGPQAAQQVQAAATWIVQSRAKEILTQGDSEAQFVYRFMLDVLGRLAGMPGERVMILVSPGFLLTINQHFDMSLVIDRANRFNVVVNTLDTRGLYSPEPGGDISELSNVDPAMGGQLASYQLATQQEQTYVLHDFAWGTGGVYYGNSNDLASGLSQLGTTPEVSYVLGFSPQIQKMDGSFHNLKVRLAQKNKYDIQARHGYFAPRQVADPAEQAHREIVDAVFSPDEVLELPLQFQTQYFKSGAAEARLSVVSRVDLKAMHFRKAEGWTTDDLTVVTAVFDDNGIYLSGLQKILKFKLLEKDYEKLLRTGVAVKFDFDLQPGRYMVRQVVRDSEGAQLGSISRRVVIP